MENKSIIHMLVFLTVFTILTTGCAQKAEVPTVEEQEKIADTGVLVVDSTPSTAQVYVDGELKGQTPLTLYNLPVGTYNVIVKKEGYIDFEGTVNVRFGKTEEVEAELILSVHTKTVEEEKPAEKPIEEKMPEDVSPLPQSNKINLSMFAMYHDFEKGQFTDIRTDKSDLFSRKYDTYVHFTALNPAKIQVIDKPIKDVQKEDCIFSDTAVAIVYSRQTLCVRTIEGSVAAIGGSWQTMPAELEWVLFS